MLAAYRGKVKLAAVPFKGRDGRPVTVALGSSYVIPTRAKNPSAACKWALALTEDAAWDAAAAARAATVAKNKSSFTGLFTGQPAADRAIRSKYVKPTGDAGFAQVISTYYDVVGAGRSVGASPVGQQLKQELTTAITATLTGRKTPQQALADAQAATMAAYKSVAGS